MLIRSMGTGFSSRCSWSPARSPWNRSPGGRRGGGGRSAIQTRRQHTASTLRSTPCPAAHPAPSSSHPGIPAAPCSFRSKPAATAAASTGVTAPTWPARRAVCSWRIASTTAHSGRRSGSRRTPCTACPSTTPTSQSSPGRNSWWRGRPRPRACRSRDGARCSGWITGGHGTRNGKQQPAGRSPTCWPPRMAGRWLSRTA